MSEPAAIPTLFRPSLPKTKYANRARTLALIYLLAIATDASISIRPINPR